MNIELAAFDMDGTLLNSKKELPADFYKWVESHPNIRTVIASGRQYYTLEKDFLPIRDKLIFVAENGGLVFEKNEVIYKNIICDECLIECINIIRKIPNAVPILCGCKGAYVEDGGNIVNQNAKMYYHRINFVSDIFSVISSDSFVKIAVFFAEYNAEKALKYFENIDSRLKTALSGSRWIDVANADVSKGSAIKAIQKRYNISYEESMAFGDYLNDYELLQSCGESYCMANGHSKLKEIAKYIADSNDNDGVMKVLRQL